MSTHCSNSHLKTPRPRLPSPDFAMFAMRLLHVERWTEWRFLFVCAYLCVCVVRVYVCFSVQSPCVASSGWKRSVPTVAYPEGFPNLPLCRQPGENTSEERKSSEQPVPAQGRQVRDTPPPPTPSYRPLLNLFPFGNIVLEGVCLPHPLLLQQP